MGLADTVTKAYMKENTVFADAFNYLIYGGKTVVNPAQLKPGAATLSGRLQAICSVMDAESSVS